MAAFVAARFVVVAGVILGALYIFFADDGGGVSIRGVASLPILLKLSR